MKFPHQLKGFQNIFYIFLSLLRSKKAVIIKDENIILEKVSAGVKVILWEPNAIIFNLFSLFLMD